MTTQLKQIIYQWIKFCHTQQNNTNPKEFTIYAVIQKEKYT